MGPMTRPTTCGALAALMLSACTSASDEGAGHAGAGGGGAGTGGSGAAGGAGGSSASGGAGGAEAPSAAALLALTANCNAVGGDYATDDGGPEVVAICGLAGAVFWTADLDVDCDGQSSAVCNAGTDPAYQGQTSAADSNGDPLDAASLPYVVVPLPSVRFDYAVAGLELGSVVAVLYQGQLLYAVFGDEGPEGIIGEASYAAAQALGIDPDPATGGSDGPVTYIAFTGAGAVVAPIEDHAAAMSLGAARAAALLHDNP